MGRRSIWLVSTILLVQPAARASSGWTTNPASYAVPQATPLPRPRPASLPVAMPAAKPRPAPARSYALPAKVAAKVASKVKAGLPAKIAVKPAPKAAKRVAGPTPSEFIAGRAQKILALLKSRPVHASGGAQISASASKASWVESVYAKNLIESSWATEMLSDKRLLYEVLERELGNRASQYYPRTLGLREFLSRHRLVDAKGQIVSDGDRIDDALHEEFPAGFVVRPAVGVAPQETGRGLFPESDLFIVELLRPGTPLYSPSHLALPVRSHILGTIASGEAVVLQENFINASAVHHPLKNRYFQEVRVHTYESEVVPGAVPSRWVQSNLLSKQQIKSAETFVSEFLSLLPAQVVNKQAWGIDVAVLDNGDMRINDVVTNRGRAIAWSSYLDQPRVIGAYSRLFESSYGVKFKGLSGVLIRHNFANYVPYWSRRIEMAKPGLAKAMAFLPPMP